MSITFHMGRGGPETSEAVTEMIDKLQPGAQLVVHANDHAILIMATSQDGFHSGRRRYLVACMNCSALLHEATTGPIERVDQHLQGVQ